MNRRHTSLATLSVALMILCAVGCQSTEYDDFADQPPFGEDEQWLVDDMGDSSPSDRDRFQTSDRGLRSETFGDRSVGNGLSNTDGGGNFLSRLLGLDKQANRAAGAEEKSRSIERSLGFD